MARECSACASTRASLTARAWGGSSLSPRMVSGSPAPGPSSRSGRLLGGGFRGLGGGFCVLLAPGGELLRASRLLLAADSGILGGRHGPRNLVQDLRVVTGCGAIGRPSTDSICFSQASTLPMAGPTQP